MAHARIVLDQLRPGVVFGHGTVKAYVVLHIDDGQYASTYWVRHGGLDDATAGPESPF